MCVHLAAVQVNVTVRFLAGDGTAVFSHILVRLDTQEGRCTDGGCNPRQEPTCSPRSEEDARASPPARSPSLRGIGARLSYIDHLVTAGGLIGSGPWRVEKVA